MQTIQEDIELNHYPTSTAGHVLTIIEAWTYGDRGAMGGEAVAGK